MKNKIERQEFYVTFSRIIQGEQDQMESLSISMTAHDFLIRYDTIEIVSRALFRVVSRCQGESGAGDFYRQKQADKRRYEK